MPGIPAYKLGKGVLKGVINCQFAEANISALSSRTLEALEVEHCNEFINRGKAKGSAFVKLLLCIN